MKYSFKEAAVKILERFSEPKTAKEITEIAIDEGLIETSGETPEATMAAQISLPCQVDIEMKMAAINTYIIGHFFGLPHYLLAVMLLGVAAFIQETPALCLTIQSNKSGNRVDV